jgi:Ca2+-binding EF-hand superfamily protein
MQTLTKFNAITLGIITIISPILASADYTQHQTEILAMFDVNQDSQITQDEVQFIRDDIFNQADIDKNGLLTTTELQNYRLERQVGQRNIRFITMDTNQDSTISLAEFNVNKSVRDVSFLEIRFNQADIDNNGLLSNTEFINMPHRNRSNDVQHLDLNQDGLISKDEFTNNLPRFNCIDVNQDGIATQQELANMSRGHCRVSNAQNINHRHNMEYNHNFNYRNNIEYSYNSGHGHSSRHR